jgi:hypothetical protein
MCSAQPSIGNAAVVPSPLRSRLVGLAARFSDSWPWPGKKFATTNRERFFIRQEELQHAGRHSARMTAAGVPIQALAYRPLSV